MEQEKLAILKSRIIENNNIRELLAQGKKDDVTNILVGLTQAFAKKGKFTEADFIRGWLIEIDPMALNTIIHAAELIEEAKAAAISSQHFEVWRSLTQILTREEFSALYHSMVIRNYPNNKIITRQGSYFPALLFVNSGLLRLSTLAEGKTLPLRNVGAAEVVGASTFFDPSTWTISVKSKGSEISILTFKKLQSLKEDYPALESKLYDFCALFQEADYMLQKAQKGRRTYRRHRAAGRTAILLLNNAGVSTGTGVKADLFDISSGGISCLIRLTKKDNAIKLFGRKISASLPVSGKTQPLNKKGVVVAVRGQHAAGNEYSLHVKFEEHLNDIDIQQIVQ